MGKLVIVRPLPIVAVTASRGTGADNLKTRDPKEVWADSAVGNVSLTFDLGVAQEIDTVALIAVRPPVAGAVWYITCGVAAPDEFPVQIISPLRVPDVAGDAPALSHALWRSGTVVARFVTVTLAQPPGSPPLTVGVPVIGRAFAAALGREWGSGRTPLDTGTATALPGGGFAVAEGARKKLYGWTFGDLSADEVEQLDLIAGETGETAPALVIEDDAPTAGLRRRMHYGLFRRWEQFERRNRVQTRWALQIEQWI